MRYPVLLTCLLFSGRTVAQAAPPAAPAPASSVIAPTAPSATPAPLPPPTAAPPAPPAPVQPGSAATTGSAVAPPVNIAQAGPNQGNNSPPVAPPPGAYPPAAAPSYPPGSYPPGSYPPGSYPPGSYPPGSYPPGSYPPGSYPPGSYPPGSYPPGSYPPGSYPPGSYPPGSYPQSPAPNAVAPGTYPLNANASAYPPNQRIVLVTAQPEREREAAEDPPHRGVYSRFTAGLGVGHVGGGNLRAKPGFKPIYGLDHTAPVLSLAGQVGAGTENLAFAVEVLYEQMLKRVPAPSDVGFHLIALGIAGSYYLPHDLFVTAHLRWVGLILRMPDCLCLSDRLDSTAGPGVGLTVGKEWFARE